LSILLDGCSCMNISTPEFRIAPYSHLSVLEASAASLIFWCVWAIAGEGDIDNWVVLVSTWMLGKST